jgi:molecular chaperone GrpE
LFILMKKTEVGTEKGGASAAEGPSTGPVEALAPVEAATLTPEQLEELKQHAAKAVEHWDRLLRTTADFDNFKKRAAREKQDAIKFANENLMRKLIPVVDALEMALAAAQNSPTEAAQSLQAGVGMVHQQLLSALNEAGLEAFDATGKMFDHNLHEAVSQQVSAELPDGQVVQQLRKGYKLRDRLLRPASVVVAARPSA